MTAERAIEPNFFSAGFGRTTVGEHICFATANWFMERIALVLLLTAIHEAVQRASLGTSTAESWDELIARCNTTRIFPYVRGSKNSSVFQITAISMRAAFSWQLVI